MRFLPVFVSNLTSSWPESELPTNGPTGRQPQQAIWDQSDWQCLRTVKYPLFDLGSQPVFLLWALRLLRH
jgi:hypothetical protein